MTIRILYFFILLTFNSVALSHDTIKAIRALSPLDRALDFEQSSARAKQQLADDGVYENGRSLASG
jgi:hypothetical protein